MHGPYWSFYVTYLLHTDSIADGPVWFIELLLLFSILYATWRWLSGQRTQVAERSGKLPNYRAIWGFIIALGLVSATGSSSSPPGWEGTGR